MLDKVCSYFYYSIRLFINTYFRITIVTLNYSITKIKPIPKVGGSIPAPYEPIATLATLSMQKGPG